MTSSEVGKCVEQEIGDDIGHSNAHGVDLKTCLVHPVRRRFSNSFREGQSLDLWLILEECPQSRDGYKIVFDENNGQYGLAIGNRDDCGVFLGYYGDFFETLDAM